MGWSVDLRGSRRRAAIRLGLALLVALPVLLVEPAVEEAAAANGDLVASVTFSQSCPSGIGVGVAFDGSNLWYSCYRSSVDLRRADVKTGQVSASYNIASGLGALAYDASRNAIWAGWGGTNTGSVYLIQLDAGRNVTGSVVRFNAGAHAVDCGLLDGLAYDAGTDTLYLSDDCATTIHHYDTAGNHLTDGPNGTGDFSWAGSGCSNSGLAIGDQLLFESSDGCSTIWAVDKDAPSTVLFSFSTVVPGDPNFRDEGLACDPVTFASQGRHILWSKEAYEPMRAHAFEIPKDSCGVGGQAATRPLTLTPVKGNGPAGDLHILTARLTDPATGRGVPDVKIRFSFLPFSVNGGASAQCFNRRVLPSLQCETDFGGSVDFVYRSNGQLGLDQLRAFADLDADGIKDADEPEGSASMGWLEPIHYVALGDSYSAGQGVRPYFKGTDEGPGKGKNECHRSRRAYSTHLNPVRYRQQLDEYGQQLVTWDFVACSGAETKNVRTDGTKQDGEPSTQLNRPAVDGETDLVTINIGGNDAGFAQVLTECALRDCTDPTRPFMDGKPMVEWLPARVDSLLQPLTQTFGQIRAEAHRGERLRHRLPPAVPRHQG